MLPSEHGSVELATYLDDQGFYLANIFGVLDKFNLSLQEKQVSDRGFGVGLFL